MRTSKLEQIFKDLTKAEVEVLSECFSVDWYWAKQYALDVCQKKAFLGYLMTDAFESTATGSNLQVFFDAVCPCCLPELMVSIFQKHGCHATFNFSGYGGSIDIEVSLADRLFLRKSLPECDDESLEDFDAEFISGDNFDRNSI